MLKIWLRYLLWIDSSSAIFDNCCWFFFLLLLLDGGRLTSIFSTLAQISIVLCLRSLFLLLKLIMSRFCLHFIGLLDFFWSFLSLHLCILFRCVTGFNFSLDSHLSWQSILLIILCSSIDTWVLLSRYIVARISLWLLSRIWRSCIICHSLFYRIQINF